MTRQTSQGSHILDTTAPSVTKDPRVFPTLTTAGPSQASLNCIRALSHVVTLHTVEPCCPQSHYTQLIFTALKGGNGSPCAQGRTVHLSQLTAQDNGTSVRSASVLPIPLCCGRGSSSASVLIASGLPSLASEVRFQTLQGRSGIAY